MKSIVALAFLVFAQASGAATDLPTWIARAPALAEPNGVTKRAHTAQEILTLGETLPNDTTLVIEPGTYALDRPLVLSRKTNVVIRSASGDPASVVLRGKGWESGDDHDDLLHVNASDGVLIAGITFTECRSYGVKLEAETAPQNIDIYNCRFRNIGVRAIKGSAGKDPNVRALRGSVRYCDFENTKIPPANWLFNGDYIAGIDMMALQDWTFADNTFRNIRGRNGGARAAIFVWVRSRRIVIERNVIIDCDRGISLGNPGQSTANQAGAQERYVEDAFVENNVIWGGADCGIELWHAERIHVRHNSIFRPEQNWARGIRVGAGVAQSEIVNNLVHGNIQIEGGQVTAHHNFAGKLQDSFVDPASGDLALRAGITNGINEGASLLDFAYDAKRFPRDDKPDLGAFEAGGKAHSWVAAMRDVHNKFNSMPGTCAQFGDSITYSGAYWTPLLSKPSNMNSETAERYDLIKKRLRNECFSQKGADFGNQGKMTVRWARENIARWLRDLNPEVAVIMFGSNDVRDESVDEYEKTTREVVDTCLQNGTIPILTTAPPQTGHFQKCIAFAHAIRRIARERSLPLIDYCDEILERRRFDWDGSAADFKSNAGDTYEVPTLISRDGVHPSNPRRWQNDFSETALSRNGFTLRNYLTMRAYSDVITQVLNP